MNKKIIKDKDEILAIYSSGKKSLEGIEFFTPLDYPLQLGVMEYKKGKYVEPHIHPDLKYKVNTTQEFLYIEKGSADIVVFNQKWKRIDKIKLSSGDFILFVNGGHSVNIGKRTRIIEIKQGPYPGDQKAKIYKK